MLQSSLAATVARHEATLAQLEADHSDTCQQLQQQLGQQLTDAQDKHSAETHVSRSPHASAHVTAQSVEAAACFSVCIMPETFLSIALQDLTTRLNNVTAECQAKDAIVADLKQVRMRNKSHLTLRIN